jgi:site-specific recombinase XerD
VATKYEGELERFASFVERHGVFVVAGITRELVTRFAGTWEVQYPSTQTRAMVRARCRGFLRYCFEEGWLSFTQFASVCSTIPSAFAAATLCPEVTSRTASCLYSNVYRRRVNFSIKVSSSR